MKFALCFETDCTMQTILGRTRCSAEKLVNMENATDIYTVDGVTKYLYSAINSGDQVTITAVLLKDNRLLSQFSRLCKDYKTSPHGDLIVWNTNATDTYELEKITKGYVKNWYLELVKRAKIDYTENPLFLSTAG